MSLVRQALNSAGRHAHGKRVGCRKNTRKQVRPMSTAGVLPKPRPCRLPPASLPCPLHPRAHLAQRLALRPCCCTQLTVRTAKQRKHVAQFLCCFLGAGGAA